MIDIQLLADKKGIAREYFDATNKLVKISDESRKNVLEILGYPVDDEKALQAILDKEELEPFKNVLDPVQVINDEDLKQFYINVVQSYFITKKIPLIKNEIYALYFLSATKLSYF